MFQTNCIRCNGNITNRSSCSLNNNGIIYMLSNYIHENLSVGKSQWKVKDKSSSNFVSTSFDGLFTLHPPALPSLIWLLLLTAKRLVALQAASRTPNQIIDLTFLRWKINWKYFNIDGGKVKGKIIPGLLMCADMT